jgi:hypothetical protein
MKKTLMSFASLLLLAATCFADTPNDKVLKSFHSTFTSPKQVKWYEHKDYYEVSFAQASVRANVKYDLEGNFLSSIRYYKETQLPANILYQVKKRYADKTIFGVTEIANAEEIYYFVKLEDSKRWMTIKVSSNGQMELYEKYRKA